MKIAAAALVVAALTAGSATAAEVTDVEFLKANRCKGLATRIEGVVDVDALNKFIKSERGARATYIVDRAETEFKRARKEAESEDRRDRLTAELTGPCQAYVSGPTSVAKQ